MTLITDLPLLPSYTGAEEFVVQSGATEYKVIGSTITASVASDLAAYILANDTAVAANTTGKLNLAGGTMTGFITLHADPTLAFHPVTKQYQDTALANKVDATGGVLDATATGVTAVSTVENTTIATTEYVADKIEYEVLKKTLVSSTPVTLAYADRGTLFVEHTITAPVIINLPQISALNPNEERTEYYVVDSGINAETNNITINAFAGDTINGSSFLTIASNGASVVLATRGSNAWFIKDKVVAASTGTAGSIEIATGAETLALSSATLAVTPETLGDFADNRLYKYSQIGTSTKNIVEADAGSVYYVTYTNTGTVAITLPDPGTLSAAGRFAVEIWDAATAGTNGITITPAAGTIDGNASLSISNDKAGLKIFTDGTNYFTVANTERATSAIGTSLTSYLPLAGGTMTGSINMGIQTITDGILSQYFGGGTWTLQGSTSLFTFLESISAISMTAGGFQGRLDMGNITANRVWQMPDTGGTIGLKETVTIYNVGAGAIPITDTRVNYTSLGPTEALTLADGIIGQKLKIVHVVDGGSGILTPTTLLGYTTITFNDVGDSVDLEFGTGGWAIMSAFNSVIA